MIHEEEKLNSIVKARLPFMREEWTSSEVEVLKTKVRISFMKDREVPVKGKPKTYVDRHTTEQALTSTNTLNDVISKQQKKLLSDIISFVGRENMDEIQEVLV
jgi:hypothetical protein